MPDGFAERRYTAQDGLSLYFRDYPPASGNGRKLPVVCLAGLARNSKDFSDLAPWLAGAGHRVIAPDYRGRGRSDYDPNPANYIPQTYLNDLRHLLTLLNLHRVIVIGTSMGGLLAMAMGAAMPTAPAAIILNDVGPDIETGGLAKIRGYLKKDPAHPDWDAAIADLKTMFTGHSFDEETWRKVAEGTFVERGDGKLHFDWDTRLIEALENGPELPDLWPLFYSIRGVPVLAFRGGKSDILSARTLERMRASHQQLTAVTIPEAAHPPTLNEDAARQAIADFIAGVG